MKVRTPITLALLVAATAAPTARPAGHVSTTLDPAIAAAIRSHQTAQPAVPLITENSAGQNRLDPAVATAMRSRGTAQPVPLITENSAGQNRIGPSAAPKYGGLDPAIAIAMRNRETAQPVPLITENSAGQNALEPNAAPTPTAVTASDGFDWMAATIGATVAFAAMLFGLATARVLSRRGRAQPA